MAEANDSLSSYQKDENSRKRNRSKESMGSDSDMDLDSSVLDLIPPAKHLQPAQGLSQSNVNLLLGTPLVDD